MGLGRYILRRVAQLIPVLFGVVTLTFVMMHALPGDPVTIYLGAAQQEAAAELTEAYGFNQPLYVQFLDYLARLLQGNLGRSVAHRQPVSTLISARVAPTITLMGLAYLIALPTAIGIGLYASARHNRAGDHLSRFIGLAGLSTPNFWLGLMLIFLFAYHLQVLPASGYMSPLDDPLEAGKLLIMPVFTLATAQLAILMRITRSSMIEELRANYVQTARAYGIPERRVLYGHALRNALLPLVTIIGVQLSFLLGGAVIVEEIFAIPGLGRLFFSSLVAQDYAVVLGLTLIFSVLFMVGVLLTDLLYVFIDPRIKYD